MTYQEFIAKKEKLSEIEKAYLETWKETKGDGRNRKSKKLARLALELNTLQDDVVSSQWYK